MYIALILAAGKSSRMGKVKALLPFELGPNGEECSALANIVNTYRELSNIKIIVVTGFHAAEVEAEARALGVDYIRNPDPSRGMFSSILTGLEWCNKRSYEAVFIHPVDCPLVRRLTLINLIVAREGLRSKVLLPRFLDEVGHPPLIPASIAKKVSHYSPDLEGGLSKALAKYPQASIVVADGFTIFDMDTPQDYKDLKTKSFWHKALDPIEAFEFLNQVEVPTKGLKHALAVGEVAYILASALNQRSCHPELAKVGGFVHDFAKGKPNHEIRGALTLEALGLTVLSKIIRDHRDLTLSAKAPITEREIVYIADKYCAGSRPVTLKERFGKKRELYANDQEACAAIDRRLANALKLEVRLKWEIGLAPYDIAYETLKFANL